MSEQDIIKKAKEKLTYNGGVAWSGARWSDIFTIFDIIYYYPNTQPQFYQVSDKTHRWARLNKIHKWTERHGPLPAQSYLMLWNYAINDFEIEKL